jgi:hypothetical protein
MEGSLVAYKVFTNGSVLNASEMNEYLMNQSVITFSNSTARSSAITSPVEGMVTYLEDTQTLEIYNGTSWQPFYGIGYQYVESLYLTSSTTFSKATYPWLRAIKVKCQGAGGGGAGSVTTGASQVSHGSGGGGGGYSESFITDITGLASSVTITVGAGGSGGTSGGNASNGGTSSFSSLVIANGGTGGLANTAANLPYITRPTAGAALGTGDFTLKGENSDAWLINQLTFYQAKSGGSFLSNPTSGTSIVASIRNGISGESWGSGGTGGGASQNQATATNGGTGAQGIVIVELYA